VSTAHSTEPIRQMRANARARYLVGLNPIRIEAGDDVVNAHQMMNGWAARNRTRLYAALEESWREAVRHALKNIRLAKNLSYFDVIRVGLLPLGVRVSAEDNRVAVVAVRLCNGGLESGKKGVLHVPHDGTPNVPLSAVELLLMEDALAV